jgi:GDPmannose 4,6-dehydratase
MLQHDKPDDYVVATGTANTVRDFLKAAFEEVNLDWQEFTEYDAKYERPTEVEALIGDATKANEKLGWKFRTDSISIAGMMVRGDIALLENPGLKVPDANFDYWNFS